MTYLYNIINIKKGIIIIITIFEILSPTIIYIKNHIFSKFVNTLIICHFIILK